MKTWVLDTNVLVSGHLSPHGPPGRLVAEVYATRLRLAYDARMALEYEEVMRRPKFGLPERTVEAFLLVLREQEFVIGRPLGVVLPDMDDLVFLEVAAATSGQTLVTGNARHFPEVACGKVRLLSPAAACAELAGDWG